MDNNSLPFFSNKNIYLIIVIIIIVLLVGWAFFTYSYLPSKRISDTTSHIPKSLLLSKSVTSVPPAKKTDYNPLTQQRIGDGVQYDLQMSRMDAAKQIFEQFSKEGWLPGRGSSADDKKTIFQIGKGTQNLIIDIRETSPGVSHVVMYVVTLQK